MAQPLYHKDLGNGRVIEFYDDGSAGEWDIETGAGFQSYPSGTFNVKNAEPTGKQYSTTFEQDIHDLVEAGKKTEGYNYAKLKSDEGIAAAGNQNRLDVANIQARSNSKEIAGRRDIAELEAGNRWDIASLQDETSRLKIAADLQDMERRTALALVQARAQLAQSPRDMMRAIALDEGVRGDPTLQGVLQALLTGQQTAGFAGPSAGLTGAADVGSLLSGLLGSDPNAATGQQMNDMNATADYVAQNPHKLQGFEALGPDTQQGVLSLVESRGGLANNWLSKYLNSRPNQGSAMAA